MGGAHRARGPALERHSQHAPKERRDRAQTGAEGELRPLRLRPQAQWRIRLMASPDLTEWVGVAASSPPPRNLLPRRGRPRGTRRSTAPLSIPAVARDPDRDALDLVLAGYKVPCADDDRFTQDRIPASTERLLRAVCSSCEARPACDAYATSTQPAAGYWAGTPYGASRRPGRTER